jgi:signal transduction histidine kinase
MAAIAVSVTVGAGWRSAKSFAEKTTTLVSAFYEMESETESGSGEVALPYSFQNLPTRTPVNITVEIKPGSAQPHDSLLVKSVYAPLKLYADDNLIYESGQEGSYPAFLLDPPTILSFVDLPEGARRLRFEYLSPTQRDTLTVAAPLMGSEAALLARSFRQNGFSMLLSLTLLFIGVVMAVAALFLRRGAPSAGSFLWLGLFCVSVGCWVLGENNFSVLVLPNPSLLYMMAFIGLFTLPIPFLRYGALMLNPKNKLPIAVMRVVQSAAVITALLLQLAGIAAVSKTLFVFHFLDLLAFTVLAACVVWEYARRKNEAAKQFAFPALIFVAFTSLEILNYRLRFTDIMSLFFQIGMLLFILSLIGVSFRFVRNAVRVSSEKARLEMEIATMGKRLDIQHEQYARLIESSEQTKAARHDLRHRLTALRGYLDAADLPGALRYVEEMSEALPGGTVKTLCENFAVNAVAAHYLSLAETAGIKTEARLSVPEKAGRVPDGDLCVIVGNLLENALEACERMTDGEKFIRLNAMTHFGKLLFTLDNSFDGGYTERGGVFYSRKRDDAGIGLTSVKAIAEKYRGALQCGTEDKVFTVNVYVNMGEADKANG